MYHSYLSGGEFQQIANWSADPIFKTSPEKTETNIFTIYKPPTLPTCSDSCLFPQTGSLVKGFYSLFKKCPNGCAGCFGRMILSPQPRGVRLGVGCRVFLSVQFFLTHDRNVLSWRIMLGVYAVVISRSLPLFSQNTSQTMKKNMPFVARD